ncbi:MAG TPA: hypothetical protein VGX50_10720, partial [Longimicrobium sp.]|nr:hypothetical protein [Longimicrobium sp.]
DAGHGARPRGGAARALGNTLRFVGRNLLLMVRSRWRRFGYACVNFGTPVSMRRWCAEHDVDFRQMGRAGRQEAVAELGDALMEAVGGVIPVLPVSLVATVFVRNPSQQLSELELKGCVADLVVEVEAGGGRVYVPRQDMDYAVTVGIRMLTMRHLVFDADGLFTANPAELPVLRYYANSIAHLLPAKAPAEVQVAVPVPA